MTVPRSTARSRVIAIAAAIALLVPWGACVWHDAGSRVSISLLHRRSDGTGPASAGEPRTFVTADGDVATLTRALVSLSHVALTPCGAPSAWLRVRSLFAPSLARAQHVHGGAPLEGPIVEDLLRADDEALGLAVTTPPLGRYCSVRVQLGPATAASRGISQSPALVGHTVLIEGHLQHGGIGASIPFAIDSTSERTIDVHSRDGTGADAPIELTGIEQRSVLLVMVYDSWLDGVSIPGAEPGDRDERALDNVAASFSHDATAEPGHHH